MFEFDGSVMVNTTERRKQIEQVIVEAIGGSASVGNVVVVVDDNGRLVNVVVTINGGFEAAVAAVEAFDKAEKDSIILRHVNSVYIKREMDSNSGHGPSIPAIVAAFFIVLTLYR